MSPLAPCPRCTRHVRASEASCPFCAAALDDAFRATPARPHPAARLGRSALFAFGVIAAGAGTAACGGASPKQVSTQPAPPPPGPDDGSVQPAYGVAPDPGDVAQPTPPPSPPPDEGGPVAAYGAPAPMYGVPPE